MSWQSNVKTAQEFFRELRRNGMHLADAEFKVKNKSASNQNESNSTTSRFEPGSPKVSSILVHSVVLCARSFVLERLIIDQKRRLTTRHSKFIIDAEGSDIDKEVLKDFVDYLYFEDIELTENNVLGLVQCCKQFSLQGDLLDRCGECLIKTLHLYNAVQYLELSHKYNLTVLQKQCMDIIQCSKTLFQNPFLYKSLSVEILTMILACDPLPLSEEEIVDFRLEVSRPCQRFHNAVRIRTASRPYPVSNHFYKIPNRSFIYMWPVVSRRTAFGNV